MTKSRPGSIFSSVSKTYNPYKSSSKEPPSENVCCVHSVNAKQKIEWSYDNEEIISEWCDIAQCYKWLNYHSHNYYYRLHAWFTIPAITFSTISGTASFASASIPREYQPFAPMVIGTINILIGILTTVQQYLKVSELKEAHRLASISWDKYARNISIELSKAPLERIDAATFLKFSRQEFDRLMESNPSIPIHIIRKFKEAFRGKNHEERKHFNLIKKPDICDVIVSINEKRHMWFPKRENLLLSLSPPYDTSASVEDVETGSSSTIQYHTHKENITPTSRVISSSSSANNRRNSKSNSSVFSQENLMKHNSVLNHRVRKNTSNNGSIDKSVSRTSFTTHRLPSEKTIKYSLSGSSLNLPKEEDVSRTYNNSGKEDPKSTVLRTSDLGDDGVTDPEGVCNCFAGDPTSSGRRSSVDIPALREFVSSLNIVNSSPFSVPLTPRRNSDTLLGTESPKTMLGTESPKKRFSFLSKKTEDITMRSPQCVVNSKSVNPETNLFSSLNYFSRTPSVESQDDIVTRKSHVNRPLSKRKSPSHLNNLTPRSSSSSMADYSEKTEMDKSRRNRKSRSDLPKEDPKSDDRRPVPCVDQDGRNVMASYVPTGSPGRATLAEDIDPVTYIPFQLKQNIDAESHIESSSGNSNTSILLHEPSKKKAQCKKKVRHEGYANTSDSEVGDVENVLFTVDVQREFPWSDSDEENDKEIIEQYVTVPYVSVPNVTVPYVSVHYTVPYIAIPNVSVPVPYVAIPNVSDQIPCESTYTDTSSPISSQTGSGEILDNKSHDII